MILQKVAGEIADIRIDLAIVQRSNHGLIIDNIGLNGLMIPEQRSEQRFFIMAAEWVPESTRTFHVRTGADGERTSQAIVIKVRPGEPES